MLPREARASLLSKSIRKEKTHCRFYLVFPPNPAGPGTGDCPMHAEVISKTEFMPLIMKAQWL